MTTPTIPAAPETVPPRPKNRYANLALICAAVACTLYGNVLLLPSLGAVLIGRRALREEPIAGGRGYALTAITLGIITAPLSVVVVLATLIGGAATTPGTHRAAAATHHTVAVSASATPTPTPTPTHVVRQKQPTTASGLTKATAYYTCFERAEGKYPEGILPDRTIQNDAQDDTWIDNYLVDILNSNGSSVRKVFDCTVGGTESKPRIEFFKFYSIP